MKILEVVAYFLPKKGGIEYVVYYLSKQWVKKGNEVKVVTSSIGSDIKEEDMKGVSVRRLKAYSFLKDAFAPGLKRVMKKEKPDIVHIHHPHPYFLYKGAMVAKKMKVPYVIHMHGREIIFPGVMGIAAKVYNKFFLDKVLKNASRIMTHTMKVLPQSYYLTKYKDKIAYIPHGININEFDSEIDTNVRERYDIEDKKVILFVGVLREYKGIDIMLKGMPKIIEKVPDVMFVIAGKGPEEEKLKGIVNDLGIERHVKFVGFVSDEEKVELYKAADLFVMPSPTIMESFGIVAFEAMAMKTPVIVSKGAGISEVFEKEGIGFLVEPFDVNSLASTSVKVLKDSDMAFENVKKSYEVVSSKYKWSDIAERYIEVFNEVLGWTRKN
ncbi:glycosyltransferase family 4 protein [Candidatus Woesearchaeota archaeon]|nr:glycosyltransferase family 4 protein [Candidatus Woesearchaeota archaeon]